MVTKKKITTHLSKLEDDIPFTIGIIISYFKYKRERTHTFGTAYSVYPNMIMTAAHVFDKHRNAELYEAQFVTPKGITQIPLSNIHLHENWKEYESPFFDIAVAYFPKKYDDGSLIELGKPKLKEPDDYEAGSKVSLCGYFSRTCKSDFKIMKTTGILGVPEKKVVEYDLHCEEGTSGGPIIDQETKTIFATHRGKHMEPYGIKMQESLFQWISDIYKHHDQNN